MVKNSKNLFYSKLTCILCVSVTTTTFTSNESNFPDPKAKHGWAECTRTLCQHEEYHWLQHEQRITHVATEGAGGICILPHHPCNLTNITSAAIILQYAE